MEHFRGCAAGVQQLLCGNRLLIHDTDGALIPTSGSTIGVLSTEIRTFLSRKPITLGMVSSMTMPRR